MEFPFSAHIPDDNPGSKSRGIVRGWQVWLNRIIKSVLWGVQIHLFFQATGLVPQTALKIIILPFLCDYSTCSIKLLVNTVCWSTELPSAPVKRMIIWLYFTSPAWLRVQSSFPLEETREDNNRHGGDSLMSNWLGKTAQKDRKYYGHLLFTKKTQLNFSKRLWNWESHAFLLPEKPDAFAPKSMRRQFGFWDHSCTSAGPGSGLILTWQRREKQPASSDITCNAISCSPAAYRHCRHLLFSFLYPPWRWLKQQLGEQEMKTGRDNNYQWKLPSTGCRAELKWHGRVWDCSEFTLPASEKVFRWRHQTCLRISPDGDAGMNCTERKAWTKHIICPWCAREAKLIPRVSLGVHAGQFLQDLSFHQRAICQCILFVPHLWHFSLIHWIFIYF